MESAGMPSGNVNFKMQNEKFKLAILKSAISSAGEGRPIDRARKGSALG